MHPSVKILVLLASLVAINLLSGRYVLLVSAVLVIVASLLSTQMFTKLLKRMMLFFVSIIVIYAFLTPGEYVVVAWLPSNLMFTYEGLWQGAMQMLRLVIVLAVMSITLNSAHHKQLLYGLYILLSPLKKCKLPIEQTIARIDLTIRYAEKLLSESSALSLKHFNLNKPFAMPTFSESSIDFNALKQAISRTDYLVIFFISSLLLAYIVIGVSS